MRAPALIAIVSGAERHMVFDAERRMVWYGSDINFIGVVSVAPAM